MYWGSIASTEVVNWKNIERGKMENYKFTVYLFRLTHFFKELMSLSISVVHLNTHFPQDITNSDHMTRCSSSGSENSKKTYLTMY